MDAAVAGRIANLARSNDLKYNALAEDNLMTRTLAARQLPDKSEFMAAAKNYAAEFVRNPIEATRKGIERDKVANRIANLAGHDRMSLAGQGVHAMRDPLKELAVNTSGFAGSVLGQSAGGLPGALAGDWAGAYVARRSIDDTQALREAIRESVASPGWQSQNVFAKGADVWGRTNDKIHSNAAAIAENSFDDTVGWAIGNGVAQAVQVPVPLRGGAVALTYGSEVGTGLKRAIMGEAPELVAKETWDTIKGKVPKSVAAGQAREAEMYNLINHHLQQLPPMEGLKYL